MGQVTLRQETNHDLLQAIRAHGCTIVSVRHEYGGSSSSNYRIIYPDLQGHFTITDRYDYFENLGYGYSRKDCSFFVVADYIRVERERSEGVIPIYTSEHLVAQEPEECLTKIDEWAERIKDPNEKWIIAEWHEPVRYCCWNVNDWTLTSGEVWKPALEEKDELV
jgi:hypothetical protein